MDAIIEHLYTIKDFRQIGKVLHFIPEVVLLVLFGMMANGQEFEDYAIFGEQYLESLRLFLPYRNGIPSESTIKAVLKNIDPKVLNGLHLELAEHLMGKEGESLRKIFGTEPGQAESPKIQYSIDGKTVRGNKTADRPASHIVTAYEGSRGFSIGQLAIEDKSNETAAIPTLLQTFSCKGAVITIDAAGTQKSIASLVVGKQADYVLALKKNHVNFFGEAESYFNGLGALPSLKKTEGAYKKTVEVGHGREEIREYFLVDDLSHFPEAAKWKGIQTVGMVRSTVVTKDKTTVSLRYYVSSMGQGIEAFIRAVRGHWAVESMHWHLDVAFREDASKVINKNLAENLNLLRKISLSFLKLLEFKRKLSIAKKRYALSVDFSSHVEKIKAL